MPVLITVESYNGLYTSSRMVASFQMIMTQTIKATGHSKTSSGQSFGWQTQFFVYCLGQTPAAPETCLHFSISSHFRTSPMSTWLVQAIQGKYQVNYVFEVIHVIIRSQGGALDP